MGVSSTTNRVALAGDGSSVTFPFPYYFFRKVDLIVYVYDTLLGGVTGPLILNTDYTISGTPNFQGLYQSGGSVVFSTYVPLTTDIVVIIRSPIEQQNYSLLQGGTISSAAIVQQFDYLTLLIQRLEDQIARCIQVPNGVGAAFSNQIPDNVAFQPGNSPIVNSTGTGWTLGGGGSGGGGGGGTTPFTVVNGGDINFSILATAQYVLAQTSLTAQRTYTLPIANVIGQQIIVKNPSYQTFNLVIAGNGGDVIDVFPNVTLLPGNSVTLICSAVGQWDAN